MTVRLTVCCNSTHSGWASTSRPRRTRYKRFFRHPEGSEHPQNSVSRPQHFAFQQTASQHRAIVGISSISPVVLAFAMTTQASEPDVRYQVQWAGTLRPYV